nr:hypothetical protein Iba_scaffold17031CG0020 [Ipomoea batatas]
MSGLPLITSGFNSFAPWVDLHILKLDVDKCGLLLMLEDMDGTLRLNIFDMQMKDDISSSKRLRLRNVSFDMNCFVMFNWVLLASLVPSLPGAFPCLTRWSILYTGTATAHYPRRSQQLHILSSSQSIAPLSSICPAPASLQQLANAQVRTNL